MEQQFGAATNTGWSLHTWSQALAITRRFRGGLGAIFATAFLALSALSARWAACEITRCCGCCFLNLQSVQRQQTFSPTSILYFHRSAARLKPVLTDCFGLFLAGFLVLGKPLLSERPAAELTSLHAFFLGIATPPSDAARFTTHSLGVVSVVLGLVLQAARRRQPSGYTGGNQIEYCQT